MHQNMECGAMFLRKVNWHDAEKSCMCHILWPCMYPNPPQSAHSSAHQACLESVNTFVLWGRTCSRSDGKLDECLKALNGDG